MRTDGKVIVNLPKSNRIRQKFIAKFPNAHYYGATSLGSGRASYLINEKDFEANKEFLKSLKITKARSIYN